MKDFPRRNQLDKCTVAELSIFEAITEVEKVGADVRLTNAVMKLQEAKEFVSDFIDGVEVKDKGFLERLIDEKNELDVRIEKLESFIPRDEARRIDPIQLSLLRIQLASMKTYSQCLRERLIWLQK
jgi:uncharacterized protein YdcH (DUF465 family)